DRGRGHASFTFNMEAIGLGKCAALPDVICKPPPPFPSTDNKPVPLKTRDEDYMLALKQDFRGTMKKMPYFLSRVLPFPGGRGSVTAVTLLFCIKAIFCTDWSKLPREMKPKKQTKKVCAKMEKAKNSGPKSDLDVIKKNKRFSEEKSEDEKEKTKRQGEDDEEAEEPEEYDEEELEEENDYISSYFEDGDAFGAVSDDNM
ncbi:RPC7 polymerase, partial [Rhadina sibilatrix]|nr:RPC7 polymerase [Rhadina sibilatrix]